MLKPDLIVASVRDVTLALLSAHGVKGVLVDLDDTLLASNSDVYAEGVREWFGLLNEAGVPVVLLSNGELARVDRCRREFGVRGLHLAGKPFFWAYRRGLSLLGTSAGETAMVGDQVFTDVLGANLMGMMTILVRPLSPGKLPHTRLARRLERLYLRGVAGGRTVDR